MELSGGLDFDSPVPRYHQIAQDIRARIERGELGPGDTLLPLRAAAETWGVNLHTVRHAYTELARDGLVESRRALGTQVTARARRAVAPADRAGREEFLARVVREASERFGMSPQELGSALSGMRAGAPERTVVHVVECSERQCEDLAGQLGAAWEVDARPWCLENGGAPPEGPVVATYFHFNQIRVRWPHRLAKVRFSTIIVDPALADRVRARAAGETGPDGRIVVVLHELDQPTLDAVASDLSVVLPEEEFDVRTRLIERPGEAVGGPVGGVALVAPRVWGRMTADERASDRAIEARYVFDPDDLGSLGRELGWTARAARR